MKFIKIKLKSDYEGEIKNVESVVEEEKGIRVITVEGHEVFAPYDNLLYYSKSGEQQQDVNLDKVVDKFTDRLRKETMKIT